VENKINEGIKPSNDDETEAEPQQGQNNSLGRGKPKEGGKGANEYDREDKFLLQEHREVWEYVRKVTDLEHGWLKFYWTIVAASFAALGVLYFYAPRMWADRYKLWIVTSAILLGLIIVSTLVLRNFHILREKSVEYRNHLNIIRAWFLPEDSRFRAFIREKKGEKNDNQIQEENGQGKKERQLRWEYLPDKPDQRFFAKGIVAIIIFSSIPSIIFGAFSFSVLTARIHLLDPGPNTNESELCWRAVISAIIGIAVFCCIVIYSIIRSLKYDRKKIYQRDH